MNLSLAGRLTKKRSAFLIAKTFGFAEKFCKGVEGHPPHKRSVLQHRHCLPTRTPTGAGAFVGGSYIAYNRRGGLLRFITVLLPSDLASNVCGHPQTLVRGISPSTPNQKSAMPFLLSVPLMKDCPLFTQNKS